MRILVIIVVAVALLYLINYLTNSNYGKNLNETERFAEQQPSDESNENENNDLSAQPYSTDSDSAPVLGDSVQQNNSVEPENVESRSSDCFPKDQLSPDELLPQDSSSLWAQVNPDGQGQLSGRNFLQAGHHVGVNTVGQPLRNPNYGLRSEPPNPQVKVSPWQQSTIDPDANRRPMEIGGCQ